MIAFLFASGFCRYEFDIHGGMKEIFTDDNKMLEFGVSFGDFGHTVQIQAWNTEDQLLTIKYSYTNNPINISSANVLDTSIVYLNDNSQYAVFAIESEEKNAKVLISVASTVRPVNINSSTALIFSFQVFFGIIFLITGILQYIYYNGAMDPREYVPNE